nr:hypothetical protein [Myxococcota bacterium]
TVTNTLVTLGAHQIGVCAKDSTEPALEGCASINVTVVETDTDSDTEIDTDTEVDTDSDTGPACGGLEMGGFCWYFGEDGQSCDAVCADHGGYHEATRTYAGSDGTNAQCNDLLTAFGAAATFTDDGYFEQAEGIGIGCSEYEKSERRRITAPTTDDISYVWGYRRVCACNL